MERGRSRRDFLAAGAISRVGSVADAMREKGARTQVFDVKHATVMPGLNDSHTHPIRGAHLQPGAALARRGVALR